MRQRIQKIYIFWYTRREITNIYHLHRQKRPRRRLCKASTLRQTTKHHTSIWCFYFIEKAHLFMRYAFSIYNTNLMVCFVGSRLHPCVSAIEKLLLPKKLYNPQDSFPYPVSKPRLSETGYSYGSSYISSRNSRNASSIA